MGHLVEGEDGSTSSTIKSSHLIASMLMAEEPHLVYSVPEDLAQPGLRYPIPRVLHCQIDVFPIVTEAA